MTIYGMAAPAQWGLNTVVSELARSGRMLAMVMLLAVTTLVAPSPWAQDTPININTAAAEELSTALTGIGLAKARLIVEYREAHGPFEHIDELAEVRGIGESTVDKNRSRITLD